MSSQNKKLGISPDSCSDTELDRISNLPGEVADHILSYLPIKDAVKTSLLSTKWRYKYSTLSSLVFDTLSFPCPLGPERLDATNKLVSLVDRVLLLHSGPIHKFELSVEHSLPADEIEKWILHLSRRHLKVFVLDITNRERLRMPSSVFSCQSLTCLELVNCALRPPSTFRGFKNLKSLCLKDVDVDQGALENMISRSPRLEIFTFIGYGELRHLRIDAPNMQKSTIQRHHVRVSLQNTPRLTVFSMDLSDHSEVYEGESYLRELLAGMPQIQRLSLKFFSLRSMANGNIPEELPAPLVNLHHLSIEINFDRVKETSALLCLLRSAPNLQELDINSVDDIDEDWEIYGKTWESDNWNRPFTHLRHVKIGLCSGTESEINFINFMLSNSLALETLTIDDPRLGLKLEKQLPFIRASPKAKILVLDLDD